MIQGFAMRRIIRSLFTVILLVFVCFSNSGCRMSPVLEQVIYTMADAETDHENETKVKDNAPEHEDMDDSLSSKAEDEQSNTERDWEEADPQQGEGENEESVEAIEYDSNAARRQAPDDPDRDDGVEDVDVGGSAFFEEGTLILAGTERVMRQIVNANGQIIDIPQDVGTVAAVGEAAIIVQMLGGAGRLAATSQSVAANPWASVIFGDEGLARTPALWSGEGDSAISQAGFERLLELSPDVCLDISGWQSFTAEQLEQLAAHGIAYMVLPPLNNSGNIKTSVFLVGELLGDKSGEGGLNAPALASSYISWFDGIVASVRSRVERFNYGDLDFDFDKYASRSESILESETADGFYTLYISDWDPTAQYKVYSDTYITLSGQGAAIAPSGYSTSPMSYYMSLAGVVNTAAAYADQFKLRHWYVNPLQSSTRIIEIGGQAGEFTAESLTSIPAPGGGSNVYLGQSEFPAVIVASSAIKSALEEDAGNRKLWTDYGAVASADGKLHGYGFADEIGQFVSSDIRGDYDIHVNPNGLGSWTSGSAEGVLEAVWIARLYYDAFSQSELEQEIADFYSTFYRYRLSAGEMEQILSGRQR